MLMQKENCAFCLRQTLMTSLSTSNTDVTSCMGSRLQSVDESGSNLFVIGDRRNRFLTNSDEYQLFCSAHKSWVKDIDDYIRQCMPKFSTQKLMTRKLGNQIQIQANKICDSQLYPTNQLFQYGICLNQVNTNQYTYSICKSIYLSIY